MLKTPASFTPLMAPADHTDPLTLVFCEGRLLVREPVWYLGVCTVALFALFALPGWILFRDARAGPKAA